MRPPAFELGTMRKLVYDECVLVGIDILQSPITLRDAIQKSAEFNWQRAAAAGNLGKLQLYRWFYDTYMRAFYQPMSSKDMFIVRKQVSNAMSNNQAMDQNFKDRIQFKLSRKYERIIFAVVFNNAKALFKHSKKLFVSVSLASETNERLFSSFNQQIQNSEAKQQSFIDLSWMFLEENTCF